MILKLSLKQSMVLAIPVQPPLKLTHHDFCYCKIRSSANDSTNRKPPFKLPLQWGNSKWKFTDIDPDAVKTSLNTLLSSTYNFVNEVTSPLVKTGKLDNSNDVDHYDSEDILVGEQNVQSELLNRGNLSLAAAISIEQFSRMNGLTGQKMQKLFEALVPKSLQKDARYLVEYCCFRFLSRDNSDIHPSLQELAFRRLIFITMLAWEKPHRVENNSYPDGSEEASLQTRLVREEAFSHIAPALSGVADRPTVHNIYKALAGDKGGISFSVWSSYINGLLKVHKNRKSYELQLPHRSSEQVLCVGSSKKQPVLKWENNMAWPGKLTLTERALYFEPIDFLKSKRVERLDVTGPGAHVKKTKVGLFGSVLFDSAVSISSAEKECKPWVLEFIDLGGDMRRDVWHASMNEVIALHKFVQEFGPEEDGSISHIYGADKGKERAKRDAINSISRLQSLQSMKKLLDEPLKLLQFSYLQHSPYGDVVYQTLALNYWGGPLVSKFRKLRSPRTKGDRSLDELSEVNYQVNDVDGSVYLSHWMTSPTWASSNSISFWRNASLKEGLVLSKNLIVGGASLTERAARICREKSKVIEKTQATIDAATLEGIPSNIDLFKELVLPLSIMAGNVEKLRRWENPFLTISFLGLAYTVIFRNLLAYVFPTTLIGAAAIMLSLKALREQGRLGRSFGKVTIRDQPPSNTVQKIIALKQAMRDMENYLQNINVTLLKLRTIVLSGQPQYDPSVETARTCGTPLPKEVQGLGSLSERRSMHKQESGRRTFENVE
ncbi:CMRF35-like molecule 8 [Bienertia sinuspersici]